MAIEQALRSQNWVLEQLTQLHRQRPELVQLALDRLLREDTELRWALVVGAYLEHHINLGRAAELLDMHELELQDRFLELGVPLRLGPTDFADARAEVEASRRWFGQSPHETTP